MSPCTNLGIGLPSTTVMSYSLCVQLSEKDADALLRKNLRKYCAVFRSYGSDSLFLVCVSYNCGPTKILGEKGIGSAGLYGNSNRETETYFLSLQ